MMKFLLKLLKEILVIFGIFFVVFNMCKILIVDFGVFYYMIIDIRI